MAPKIGMRKYYTWGIFSLSFASLFSFAVTFPSVSDAVSSLDGLACSKLSASSVLNKTVYVCIDSSLGKIWKKVPAVPKTQALFTAVVNTWISDLTNIDYSLLEGIITDNLARIDEYKSRIPNFDVSSNTYAIAATNLATSLTTIQSNISQDGVQLSTVKSNSDALGQKYNALVSQVNSMSADYQQALRDRTASVACQIQAMFGYVGSCYTNQYLDVQNLQTVQRYNVLTTQMTSAGASYRASLDEVVAATKTLNADSTVREINLAQADLVKQDQGVLRAKQALVAAYVNNVNSLFSQVTQIRSDMQSQMKYRDKEVLVLSQALSSHNWQAQFPAAFSWYRSGINMSTPPSIGSLDVQDIGEPPTDVLAKSWIPTGFFDASRYSSVKLDAPGFAYSWSKFYDCAGSCVVALGTVSENCGNATLTLDWKDATGTSVGQSSISAPTLIASTIHEFVIPFPSNLDATRSYSAYLAAFSCARS